MSGPWLIFFTVLLGHGIILLNDGPFFDGWVIYSLLADNNWGELRSLFLEHGSPAMAYFHWSVGHLGPIVLGYRVTALLSILAAAIFVYAILVETGWLSRADALWVAILAALYPGMQANFELIHVTYAFCYALFLGGFWAAFRAERVHGPAHVALRILVLITLFASYTTNSLLVYHYGFLILLFTRIGGLHQLRLRDVLVRYLPRRLDYVLLPIVFWVLKQTLFPRHGLYADYNRFQLSPVRFLANSALFLVNGVYGQVNQALLAVLGQPALVLLLVLACSAAWSRARGPRPGEASPRVSPWMVLAGGLLLLALGMFPYVAVGLAPTLRGWSTRHTLLLGLPLSLLVVAGTRLALSAGTRQLEPVRSGVLLTLAVGYFLATEQSYIGWQARRVKDQSIIQQLSGLDQARQFSVIWIEDEFPLGGEGDYRFYEWSSMFRSAWGTQRTIGLDRKTATPDFLTTHSKFFTSRYNLRDFDPAGCQARLTVRSRRKEPAAALASRYLYLRHVRPEGLQPFLSGMAELRFEPLTCRTPMQSPAAGRGGKPPAGR
jgi:hypothetical protein